MKKLFLICTLLFCHTLHSADILLQQQQLAKYQVGVGISTNNWLPYIYGFSLMQQNYIGNPLINYILGNSGPVPANGALLYTDGMVGLPTYPLVSKFAILVSPSLYNSTLPSNEAILIKNQNLFGTIQSALNFAVVNYANKDTYNRWTILVDPGTYTESLQIGTNAWPGADIAVSVTLAALGKVTVNGNIACNMTRNDQNTITSNSRYQSILFTALRTDSANYNARWIVTGTFTFNRANAISPYLPQQSLSTVLLQLQYMTINGAVDLSLVNNVSGSTGCYFDLFECVFNSTFIGGTGGILLDAQGCVFNGLLTVNQYHNIHNCKMVGMTCASMYNSQAEGIAGIYRSTLTGAYTCNAGQRIYIDHFTDGFSPAATYPTAGSKKIMSFP
jgi:hypothetical protein